MPGGSGFGLLEELEYLPHVIFTTAFNEYAVKAFEVNALDYLLKPVNSNRLDDAIKKLDIKIEEEEKTGADILSVSDKVFVKDGEKCWFVNISEIMLFEVYGNYTRIHFDKENPLIPKNLNYLEKRLDTKVFFRINRQQIINLKFVDKIDSWFKGTIKVILRGGLELEISRRQAQKFKDTDEFLTT